MSSSSQQEQEEPTEPKQQEPFHFYHHVESLIPNIIDFESESESESTTSFRHLVDKVFVINLKHRTDRWQQVQEQLQRYNIQNVERFDAVCPTSSDMVQSLMQEFGLQQQHIDYFYQDAVNYTPHNLDKYVFGTVGCLCSHLSIIRLAKERKYHNIVILEDDFLLSYSNWMDIFYQGIQELPNDWHMLYLGGRNVQPLQSIPNAQAQARYVGRCTNTVTTVGYMMNHRCFDAVLNQTGSKTNITMDVYYGSHIQRNYNCYALKPYIIRQRPDKSDIIHRFVDYQC
jgi:GR25 family glycosyltransferase involved in LPS biosynthesis